MHRRLAPAAENGAGRGVSHENCTDATFPLQMPVAILSPHTLWVTFFSIQVAELRSHLRLVQRESDGWQARSQALVDEKERLLANLEEGGHPVLDHMEQVVGKLREDFNGKVRELLDVQNQMMQQQIELRHRDERIKQLEGEVEARDNTIASLRDYVVDAGDFLARDKPFM